MLYSSTIDSAWRGLTALIGNGSFPENFARSTMQKSGQVSKPWPSGTNIAHWAWHLQLRNTAITGIFEILLDCLVVSNLKYLGLYISKQERTWCKVSWLKVSWEEEKAVHLFLTKTENLKCHSWGGGNLGPSYSCVELPFKHSPLHLPELSGHNQTCTFKKWLGMYPFSLGSQCTTPNIYSQHQQCTTPNINLPNVQMVFWSPSPSAPTGGENKRQSLFGHGTVCGMFSPLPNLMSSQPQVSGTLIT